MSRISSRSGGSSNSPEFRGRIHNKRTQVSGRPSNNNRVLYVQLHERLDPGGLAEARLMTQALDDADVTVSSASVAVFDHHVCNFGLPGEWMSVRFNHTLDEFIPVGSQGLTRRAVVEASIAVNNSGGAEVWYDKEGCTPVPSGESVSLCNPKKFGPKDDGPLKIGTALWIQFTSSRHFAGPDPGPFDDSFGDTFRPAAQDIEDEEKSLDSGLWMPLTLPSDESDVIQWQMIASPATYMEGGVAYYDAHPCDDELGSGVDFGVTNSLIVPASAERGANLDEEDVVASIKSFTPTTETKKRFVIVTDAQFETLGVTPSVYVPPSRVILSNAYAGWDSDGTLLNRQDPVQLVDLFGLTSDTDESATGAALFDRLDGSPVNPHRAVVTNLQQKTLFGLVTMLEDMDSNETAKDADETDLWSANPFNLGWADSASGRVVVENDFNLSVKSGDTLLALRDGQDHRVIVVDPRGLPNEVLGMATIPVDLNGATVSGHSINLFMGRHLQDDFLGTHTFGNAMNHRARSGSRITFTGYKEAAVFDEEDPPEEITPATWVLEIIDVQHVIEDVVLPAWRCDEYGNVEVDTREIATETSQDDPEPAVAIETVPTAVVTHAFSGTNSSGDPVLRFTTKEIRVMCDPYGVLGTFDIIGTECEEDEDPYSGPTA